MVIQKSIVGSGSTHANGDQEEEDPKSFQSTFEAVKELHQALEQLTGVVNIFSHWHPFGRKSKQKPQQ